MTSLMATNFKCADDAYACLSSAPSMSRPLAIGIDQTGLLTPFLNIMSVMAFSNCKIYKFY